ncbi:MAG: hypothetical protein AAFS07_15515 [Pseudomonadota bacterium]
MITAVCIAALAAMAYTTFVAMRQNEQRDERQPIRVRVEDEDRRRRR